MDEEEEGALADLVGFLRKRRGQSGIVYCHKRVTAEELARELNEALGNVGDGANINTASEKQFLAMPYHGKMSDGDRSLAQVRGVVVADYM